MLTIPVYGQYPIAKIRPSPDNRKRFNEQALQELAASIQSMGVAQPILIRPVMPTAEEPEEFELVAGERRWRASKIAGLTVIPAMCRDLSNLDAAKIRILENLQREDPHPIEEAEGYQQLMLQHGYSADQLAEEIKKSRAYIYGRLKLCALTTEVRESFLEDKIPASTALLIARIPVPALQVKALNEITQPHGGMSAEPLSYRRAVEWIQGRYMLDLATAIFKRDDGKLLASAGPCTKCPKRTGNQPELYQGVSADVCTDPDCYSEKRAAHHAATLVLANKTGIPVYEGADTQRFLSMRWRADCELVFGDTSIQLFARNAPETKNAGHVGAYLKDAMPATAGYVKYNDGTMLPMYERIAVQQALEDVGACETVEAHAARIEAIAADPTQAPAKSAHQLRLDQEQLAHQAAREAAEKESTFRVALYKQLRQRASIEGLGLASLREYTKAVLNEHGLASSLHDLYEHDVSTDLDSFIGKADSGTLQLLLIDAFLGSMLKVDWYNFKNGNAGDDGFETIDAMSRHEGIDPDQVREELFPSPIDVASMQHDDLVTFIGKYPQRLAELTGIVLEHPRGELVGMLEQAANELGYVYKDRSFVPQPVEPVTQAVTEPAPTAAEAELQPHDSVTASDDAAADADCLAEPLEEVNAPKPAEKKLAAKNGKQKTVTSTPAKNNKKATAKPNGKPIKQAAAEDGPWPFPKSSTQPREATAPAVAAEEAVQA